MKDILSQVHSAWEKYGPPRAAEIDPVAFERAIYYWSGYYTAKYQWLDSDLRAEIRDRAGETWHAFTDPEKPPF